MAEGVRFTDEVIGPRQKFSLRLSFWPGQRPPFAIAAMVLSTVLASATALFLWNVLMLRNHSALRGIQIQIRVVDPTNSRVKSITIRQDFTDKL